MSRVAGQGKHPDEERWVCSKDPKHLAMTSALKAIKLPEGSPAVRCLELGCCCCHFSRLRRELSQTSGVTRNSPPMLVTGAVYCACVI